MVHVDEYIIVVHITSIQYIQYNLCKRRSWSFAAHGDHCNVFIRHFSRNLSMLQDYSKMWRVKTVVVLLWFLLAESSMQDTPEELSTPSIIFVDALDSVDPKG